MKIIKTICLDNEIAEKLKDNNIKNVSGLINSLLTAYFSEKPKEMSLEEINKKEQEASQEVLKEAQIEVDKYEKEKQRNIRKMELLTQYEKETPRDLQNKEGWEKYYQEHESKNP